MFKRNVSPNLKGRIRQHYQSEQNNGTYEGDMLHYLKDGVGMFLSDEGSIYFGNFSQDTFHGEGVLLFKIGGILYAKFQKGQLHGFFFASLCSEVSCGYMYQGKLQGPVFYYSPQQKLWQFYEYNQGKKIRKIAEELAENERQLPSFLVRDKTLYAKYLSFLDLSIESIFNKNVQKNLSLIESEHNSKQRFVGFINKEGKLNGLGCILLGDKLQSGGYSEGKINGLGRIQHPNEDYYDGFFSKDCMEGQGFYYTQQTNSYILAQFKRNECVHINHSAFGQPTALCLKMRKEFHQKSLSYMNGQLHFKSILICLPDIFKSFSEQLDDTSHQPLKAELRMPSAEEELQNTSTAKSPRRENNKQYLSKPFSISSPKPNTAEDVSLSQNVSTPKRNQTSQHQFNNISSSNLSNRIISQTSASSQRSAPFQQYPRARSSLNKSSSSLLVQSFPQENENSLNHPSNQLDDYSPKNSYSGKRNLPSPSRFINSLNQPFSSQNQRNNGTPIRNVSQKLDDQGLKTQRYKPIFQEERIFKPTDLKNKSQEALEKQISSSSNFSLVTFSPLKFNQFEVQASLSEKSKIKEQKDQSSKQQKSVSPFRIPNQTNNATKLLDKSSSRPFLTLGEIMKRQTLNQNSIMKNQNVQPSQLEINQTFTDITRSAQILQVGRSDYQGFGLTSQRINSHIDYPFEQSQAQISAIGKDRLNKTIGISSIQNKQNKQFQ